MMSMFEKRKNEIAPPATARPTPAAEHKRSADALLFVQRLQEDADMLQEQNNKLRADLNLARMRCADLERAMHDMRADLESYRKYSVEVRTHLQHITDAARRANDAACVAADTARETIAAAEREARIAAEEIAGKYGANGGEPAAREP